jgi:hypothetical protein
MKSLKTRLLIKSLIAAAIVAGGFAASGVASSATVGGSPDDGMVCRTAPKAYIGSFVNNKFLCKRTQNHGQPLTCFEPGFATKFIREGPGGGGRDVCAAPNRSYPSNVPLTGTEGIDWKYVAVGPTQVSTIVANQRQFEATAMGLDLSAVDARAVSSGIVVNQTGSEDKLTVTLEFATYAVPAAGGIVIGGPVVTSPTPFVPRPLP